MPSRRICAYYYLIYQNKEFRPYQVIRISYYYYYGNIPSVILAIEEEVDTDYRDTNSHYKQYQEHQEHEAIHVVDLVGPERGEDEVPERWSC